MGGLTRGRVGSRTCEPAKHGAVPAPAAPAPLPAVQPLFFSASGSCTAASAAAAAAAPAAADADKNRRPSGAALRAGARVLPAEPKEWVTPSKHKHKEWVTPTVLFMVLLMTTKGKMQPILQMSSTVS